MPRTLKSLTFLPHLEGNKVTFHYFLDADKRQELQVREERLYYSHQKQEPDNLCSCGGSLILSSHRDDAGGLGGMSTQSELHYRRGTLDLGNLPF